MVAPEAECNRDLGPLAEYHIRVEIDPRYPDVEPKVFETGGAIPREDRLHVYGEGQCCVLIWETWKATAPDVSIEAFFEGPLRNFFLSQYSVALGQGWPFDEWEHGRAGLATAYAERLGYSFDEITVKKFLKGYLKILGRREIPIYWKCPCQSGRNIRDCCHDHLLDLTKVVRPEEAQAMGDRLTMETRTAQARTN